MSEESILQKIKTAPRYYLFDHPKVDGASMYGNFLSGVYDEAGCLSTPRLVELSAQSEYHRACAIGSQLSQGLDGDSRIPLNYGNTPGLIDYMWQQCLMEPDCRPSQPKPLEAFSYIALIAFAAEYCIVDVSTADEYFRQAFHQGRAVTPCERRPLAEVANGIPYLQVYFTIAPPVFQSRVITPGQLKEVLYELRHRAWIPQSLRIKYSRQKTDGFYMSLISG